MTMKLLSQPPASANRNTRYTHKTFVLPRIATYRLKQLGLTNVIFIAAPLHKNLKILLMAKVEDLY